MENVDNVKIGDFTDIQIDDKITLTTQDNETFTGIVKAIDGMDSLSWSTGNRRVTITLDDGIEKVFYHNKLKSYKKIESTSTRSSGSTVASDILTQEQSELACIKDELFTGYMFGDMNLAQTPLYQSDLKFLDTLEKMKALHQGLLQRNKSNQQITSKQCQTIVQQIMEENTNIDVLIDYLVQLPQGHFKETFDGDIIYTRQKQVDFLTPDKIKARGEAGKALESQNNALINKAAFAKTVEFDGCIFLSNREDKGEKNIIVLTKDGKIIGLTAGGNIFGGPREYKKIQIVTDGSTITDIKFETVTSVSRSLSSFGSSAKKGFSSLSSYITQKRTLGGRRTRRKSKKSSTRKGGQRGGGRCRESCKKVSKKRK